jgi:hypothetical protein
MLSDKQTVYRFSSMELKYVLVFRGLTVPVFFVITAIQCQL